MFGWLSVVCFFLAAYVSVGAWTVSRRHAPLTPQFAEYLNRMATQPADARSSMPAFIGATSTPRPLLSISFTYIAITFILMGSVFFVMQARRSRRAG
ncbi:MAG: hypothetical protein JWM57_3372 [Phycisphaerales bacterium]|nr:hypothetical protein [Phycisphaerales bacterium]